MENNLSEQDELILSQLQDPDQLQEAKYVWDDDFQRVLLGMLLSSKFFLSQSAGLVKPTYFKMEIHQTVCRILFDYFEKYKTLPSKIYIKEIISEFLSKKFHNRKDTFDSMKVLYNTELNLVYDYYSRGGVGNLMPNCDAPEAILDKVTAFSRTQAMKGAFYKSLNLIRKNPESDDTWEEVNNTIKEAQLINRNFDEGLNYFESIEERYSRMNENEETIESFTTGFERINRSLSCGGLLRGELGAWMGLPGSGKSICLTWAAACNVLKGKKVLYISTEMDSDRIASRFDAQMSRIGQHELMTRKNEVWAALRSHVSEYEDKRRLVIRQFASGTATMADVKAYYAQLNTTGFKPDLMIYDYPGDFKESSTISSWESRYRLLREIRGFSVEENHCSMIAVHPNRGNSDAKSTEDFMDENRQGDSFKQFQVLDAFWTLNQDTTDRQLNLGKVFVAKARNGKSRFWFPIRYGFKDQTLSLTEIDERVYAIERTRSNEKAASDVAIDDVKIDEVIKPYDPNEGESERL